MRSIWYCAYCGKFHSPLKKAYGFDGWERKNAGRNMDNLCGRGLVFVTLCKELINKRGRCNVKGDFKGGK